MTDKIAGAFKLAREIAEDMVHWTLVHKVGAIFPSDGHARFTVTLKSGDVFEVKVRKVTNRWLKL